MPLEWRLESVGILWEKRISIDSWTVGMTTTVDVADHFSRAKI